MTPTMVLRRARDAAWRKVTVPEVGTIGGTAAEWRTGVHRLTRAGLDHAWRQLGLSVAPPPAVASPPSPAPAPASPASPTTLRQLVALPEARAFARHLAAKEARIAYTPERGAFILCEAPGTITDAERATFVRLAPKITVALGAAWPQTLRRAERLLRRWRALGVTARWSTVRDSVCFGGRYQDISEAEKQQGDALSVEIAWLVHRDWYQGAATPRPKRRPVSTPLTLATEAGVIPQKSAEPLQTRVATLPGATTPPLTTAGESDDPEAIAFWRHLRVRKADLGWRPDRRVFLSGPGASSLTPFEQMTLERLGSKLDAKLRSLWWRDICEADGVLRRLAAGGGRGAWVPALGGPQLLGLHRLPEDDQRRARTYGVAIAWRLERDYRRARRVARRNAIIARRPPQGA